MFSSTEVSVCVILIVLWVGVNLYVVWRNKAYFAVHHLLLVGHLYSLGAFIIQMRHFPYFFLHPVLFEGTWCQIQYRDTHCITTVLSFDEASLHMPYAPVISVLSSSPRFCRHFFLFLTIMLCDALISAVIPPASETSISSCIQYTQKPVCKSKFILWCIFKVYGCT